MKIIMDKFQKFSSAFAAGGFLMGGFLVFIAPALPLLAFTAPPAIEVFASLTMGTYLGVSAVKSM